MKLYGNSNIYSTEVQIIPKMSDVATIQRTSVFPARKKDGWMDGWTRLDLSLHNIRAGRGLFTFLHPIFSSKRKTKYFKMYQQPTRSVMIRFLDSPKIIYIISACKHLNTSLCVYKQPKDYGPM